MKGHQPCTLLIYLQQIVVLCREAYHPVRNVVIVHADSRLQDELHKLAHCVLVVTVGLVIFTNERRYVFVQVQGYLLKLMLVLENQAQAECYFFMVDADITCACIVTVCELSLQEVLKGLICLFQTECVICHAAESELRLAVARVVDGLCEHH